MEAPKCFGAFFLSTAPRSAGRVVIRSKITASWRSVIGRLLKKPQRGCAGDLMVGRKFRSPMLAREMEIARGRGNISLVRRADLDRLHTGFGFSSGLIHRAIAHHGGFCGRRLRFGDCALLGLRVLDDVV